MVPPEYFYAGFEKEWPVTEKYERAESKVGAVSGGKICKACLFRFFSVPRDKAAPFPWVKGAHLSQEGCTTLFVGEQARKVSVTFLCLPFSQTPSV